METCPAFCIDKMSMETVKRTHLTCYFLEGITSYLVPFNNECLSF